MNRFYFSHHKNTKNLGLLLFTWTLLPQIFPNFTQARTVFYATLSLPPHYRLCHCTFWNMLSIINKLPYFLVLHSYFSLLRLREPSSSLRILSFSALFLFKLWLFIPHTSWTVWSIGCSMTSPLFSSLADHWTTISEKFAGFVQQIHLGYTILYL